jgi:hypothetical protein
MEEGERSAVGRSFIMNAWPPISFALPGRTCAVVTPPAMASSYDASWVFNPSILRNQGKMGALREFVSLAPFS